MTLLWISQNSSRQETQAPLLTTRNPDCKIHSTVGSCELGQINMDGAVTLLLKATGAEDTADKASRKKAIPVTQTIGFLALAVVQAGAYIRQGLCGIEEYCDMYFAGKDC